MAYTSDSLTKRSIGPALASAAVGIALGIVAVVGVNQLSDNNTVPASSAVNADEARLGDPEYGSRN
ncbi:putative secreted protein [Corynebacterium kutscheri]|uniref:DUF2613 domain-containing protein n=1 Tax=Corynebacterium kutscheri TaxID=35755 RepID=UPI000F6F0670|nr:DUF2613 domain-containing protein [Corynebacterium kutscheri]VEH81880.1 putative secreted protein [Corynebacterium kutscheri]